MHAANADDAIPGIDSTATTKPQRSRTAIIEEVDRDVAFAFKHGGDTHLHARRLVPALLVLTNDSVTVQVSRSGRVIDHGYFIVDRENSRIIARDFQLPRLQRIMGRPIAWISALHFELGDEILLVVHNGFYARAREFRAEGDHHILYVRPPSARAPVH